jgi:hypothetical protein
MGGEPLGPLTACEDSFLAQSTNVALVAKGTVTLNQAALGACIDAYQAAASSCGVDGVTAACHGIMVGHVPDGEPCEDVAECDRSAGAKVCQKILDMGDLGTCQTPPRGQEGDLCSQSCPLGADCSTTWSAPNDSYPTTLCYEEDGLYCVGGYSCEPLVAGGGTCAAPDACGSSAYCDGDTCASSSGPGDSCQFSFACGDGFSCVDSHCAPSPLADSSACVGYPPYFD